MLYVLARASQGRVHLPNQEMRIQFLGGEDSLEKKMAARSSILASKIPWTEEPVHKELDMTEQLNTKVLAHVCSSLYNESSSARIICF